jgi:tryptophan synthase beta chain
MVGSSYDQKPYRRSMMQTWGATVHRSPSDRTEAGRSQAEHPTGSLGIAISEAVEVAASDPEANYSLGSVLSHVCLHQTVIGQESIAQMEMAGEEPDVVIGCVGGGSNFAGWRSRGCGATCATARRPASWAPSRPHAPR